MITVNGALIKGEPAGEWDIIPTRLGLEIFEGHLDVTRITDEGEHGVCSIPLEAITRVLLESTS